MNVMDLPQYDYAGVTPTGQPTAGKMLTPDLARTASKKHLAGWRELSITVDGREVAGIATEETGERVWWADE